LPCLAFATKPSRFISSFVLIRAQVAANQCGILLMRALMKSESERTVTSYMRHIQANAEAAVRDVLRCVAADTAAAAAAAAAASAASAAVAAAAKVAAGDAVDVGGNSSGAGNDGDNGGDSDTVLLSAVDYMDDGTPIRLKVSIDRRRGDAVFDFAGTGAQVFGNTNAPRAVTYSAVIYCLRCLVDRDIPLNQVGFCCFLFFVFLFQSPLAPVINRSLPFICNQTLTHSSFFVPYLPNQGCLAPVTIKVPTGCILSPSPPTASAPELGVVGGNVLTSQRVVDVILKAFGAAAASQGCMNNFVGVWGFFVAGIECKWRILTVHV
jgi:5-oxoprolinase (ATP-hydrolysing)